MSASASRLELLAPAKTPDIGIAAINHGADAVYIGGPSFGARHNAGNSIAEIEKLIRHAHRYHARVFLTLNTILRDDELPKAQQLINDAWNAGIDALIIQDMGLLMLDLPAIQLHASTQCDIRTPEKARFLQDAGFSQVVAARELTLPAIREMADQLDSAVLEFFIHGALCVAYSGQCYVSHAQTGRSANRGDCSQACRLPYEVHDEKGRIIAHQKHVLSVKDNDQSQNLEALIDAGVRSFKIEGRYKDLAYVKNTTAHYRQLLDDILTQRPRLSRSSHGETHIHFTPEPERSFNRGSTDYFVNGRKEDIGAFDTPTPKGLALGWVVETRNETFDVELRDRVGDINNGDTLTYFDLQDELKGFRINTAKALGAGRFRVQPNEPVHHYKDLKRNTEIFRSRDMAWERLMESDKTASRRVPVDFYLTETAEGLELLATDEAGVSATIKLAHAPEASKDPEKQAIQISQSLEKLGNSVFELRHIELKPFSMEGFRFWPTSVINGLRRDLVESLDQARSDALPRLLRAPETDPPPVYPDDVLSYLGNVYNHEAQRFYLSHGVKTVEAAYESHEEKGDVSLMITKHCVRFSLSLCPKQTRGVLGVQGTIRAEPLQLIHNGEKLTLRFDCKACEMHVVGRMKRHVVKNAAVFPLNFYRAKPASKDMQ